jgi:hypothetical protein
MTPPPPPLLSPAERDLLRAALPLLNAAELATVEDALTGLSQRERIELHTRPAATRPGPWAWVRPSEN